MKHEADDSRAYQKWLRDHSGHVKKNGSPHREPPKLSEQQRRRIEQERRLNEQREPEARKQQQLLEQQKQQERQAELERQNIRHTKAIEYHAFCGMVRTFNSSECAYLLPNKEGAYQLHLGYGGLDSLEREEFRYLYHELITTAILHLDSADIPLHSLGVIRCYDSLCVIDKVDVHTYHTMWLDKTNIIVDSLDQSSSDISWSIPFKKRRIEGEANYCIENGEMRELTDDEVKYA